MSDEEGETIYCICRSTDVSRFMIGCDNCEEWYHGDCIDVTEEDASKIKKFYCHVCRKKDSSLEIKYKTKKVDKKINKECNEEKECKPKQIKIKDSNKCGLEKKKDDKHLMSKPTKDEKVKETKTIELTKEIKLKEKPKDKIKEKYKDFRSKDFVLENKSKIEKHKEKHREKYEEQKREEKHREDKIKDKQLNDKHKEKHLDIKLKEKHEDSKTKKDKNKEKYHDKFKDEYKAKFSKEDKSHKEEKLMKEEKPQKEEKLKKEEKQIKEKHTKEEKKHKEKHLKQISGAKTIKHKHGSKGSQSLDVISTEKSVTNYSNKASIPKASLIDGTKDKSLRESVIDKDKHFEDKSRNSTTSQTLQQMLNTGPVTKSANSSDCAVKVITNRPDKAKDISKKTNNTNSVIAVSNITKISNNNKVILGNNTKATISCSSSNFTSKSIPSSPVINKRISVDLSAVQVTDDRCGQCDACHVASDCNACNACRSEGTKETCVRRRCRHLYQVTNKSKSSSIIPDKEKDGSAGYTPPSEPHTPRPDPSSHCPASPDLQPLPQQCLTAPVVAVPKSLYQTQRAAPQPQRPVPQTPRPAPPLQRQPPPSQQLGRGVSGEESDEQPRSVLKDRNDGYSDDDIWEPNKKLWDRPESRSKTKIKKKKGAASRVASGGRKRKGHSDGQSDDSDGGIDRLGVGGHGAFGPKNQCQGPGCVEPARPHSKYCSQECGLKLAEKRIFAILPQRIQEWKLSGCTAEAHDTKKLEKIRRQQLQAQAELQRLEAKYQELERIVERGLKLTVDPQADEDQEEEGGEGQAVYCVTCGHEVATRRAIKHMENCFNKMESQTTFGSHYKTRIEGNTMFCDFYSPSTRTYCKRLRVMCPEHYKEPKVPETRVCGAPLVRDVFTETGVLCRATRKRCIKHYRWERLRRAEIDMDRVRQWMKLDELLEQERQVRASMTNRAGVLGLMLHSAYDHTLATRFEQQLKLQRQQQEQQRLQQQQQLEQQKRLQQLEAIQKQQQQQPPTIKYRVLSQHSQHTDHRYYLNKDAAGGRSGGAVSNTVATVTRLHSDHQYYRPGGSEAGQLKLKVTQSKVSGSATAPKTVIHLQKSAAAPPAYLQQQQQTNRYPAPGGSTRYYQSTSEPRYHQDHQYHHATAPAQQQQQQQQQHQQQQYQPTRTAGSQSDHLYFNSKRLHKSQ